MQLSKSFLWAIPFTLSLVSTAIGRKLIVGSGSGELTTVEFDPAIPKLKDLAINLDALPGASWQELVKRNGSTLLISNSEAYDGRRDKLSVFQLDVETGLLQVISKTSTAQIATGPVSVAVSHDASLVFSASYNSGGVNVYSLDADNGLISPNFLQEFKYTLAQPGPVKGRQDVAHPHQVLVDPTGKYLLVPDLGADFVRVFSINSDFGEVTEYSTIPVRAGSGPRHGTFHVREDGQTFYYLLHELANRLDVFEVEYDEDGEVSFTSVQEISTFPTGTNSSLFPAPTAAEVAVSDDGKFVYTTNRSDKRFQAAALGPTNGNTTVSDSIITFQVNQQDGTVTLQDATPVGGLTPRHFAIDPFTGEYIAVVTQNSNRLAIYARDKVTGSLGTIPVISMVMPSGREPTCVTWIS